jgi:beta-aspartyl-peptidase (threonine type)
MKKNTGIKFTSILLFTFLFALIVSAQEKPQFGLILHGGAGSIKRGQYTQEQEAEYQKILTKCLETGYKILEEGKPALDAVEAVINIMEDSPLFNAGKGAVLTADGQVELDASIMNGQTLAAGAVAGLHHIKNPISLARMVMEKSKHVMLAGEGAEKFALENNVPMVEPEYFIIPSRLESLKKIKAREEAEKQGKKISYIPGWEETKRGTVGVAALDKNGNLAAGTSTGGMMNKKFGRVGDSPIIGAGTYADNNTCAVSCTGSGEYFIRLSVARDIAALMEYKGMSLKDAADEVVMKKLGKLGGDGGIIAIDRNGNIAWPFNTDGMFRGYYLQGQSPVVKMYPD